MRCGIRKQGVVDSAVMGDGHLNLLTGKLLQQIIGKPLGGHAHGVNIHPVGTYAHGPTQTPGTKLQVPVKSINQFRRIFSVEQCLDFEPAFFIDLAVEPGLGFVSNGFIYHISRLVFYYP